MFKLATTITELYARQDCTSSEYDPSLDSNDDERDPEEDTDDDGVNEDTSQPF